MVNHSLFTDAEAARSYLEKHRWPVEVHCPMCKSAKRITARKDGYYRCNKCLKDFTVRTGTLMQRSHVPLNKWLLAIHLLSNDQDLTSVKLAMDLDITQKSAWLVLQRLRNETALTWLRGLRKDINKGVRKTKATTYHEKATDNLL